MKKINLTKKQFMFFALVDIVIVSLLLVLFFYFWWNKTIQDLENNSWATNEIEQDFQQELDSVLNLIDEPIK